MKRLIVLAACSVLLSVSLSHAEEVLFGGDTTHGWFFAPTWKMTSLNGETTHLSGGRGAWIINHTYMLGFGGYGIDTGKEAPGNASRLLGRPGLEWMFRYGGFEFEYMRKSDELIHWSAYCLIGSGSITYSDPEDHNFDMDDNVFVVEPAIYATINLTKWLRAGAGVSWRLAGDVDIPGLAEDDIGGPSAMIELRFGKF